MKKLTVEEIRCELIKYRNKIQNESNDPLVLLKANFTFPVHFLNVNGYSGQDEEILCDKKVINGVTCYIIKERHISGKRIMLYFHGGAYMYGSIKEYYHMCALLSKACNCEIIFVEYDLAPKSIFPTPIIQGIKVYEHFANQGDLKLFLCGDSAGATIEIGMIFKILEKNLQCPDAFVSICISGDEERRNKSWTKNKDKDIILGMFSDMLREDKGRNSAYLCGQSPIDPMISPIYGNYKGFPPCLLQVGNNECLRDDTLEIYLKMVSQSVDVTLEVYEDVPHIWHLYAPLLYSATKAIKNIGDFVKRW